MEIFDYNPVMASSNSNIAYPPNPSNYSVYPSNLVNPSNSAYPSTSAYSSNPSHPTRPTTSYNFYAENNRLFDKPH